MVLNGFFIYFFNDVHHPNKNNTTTTTTTTTTEYLPDGELYEYLRSPQNRSYSLVDCVSHARDIAGAMKYIHSQNILQCDLKSSNVLMSSDRNHTEGHSTKTVKLSDFGSAVNIDTNNKHTMGTVFNAAPELLSGKCLNTFKTDVRRWLLLVVVVVVLFTH